MTTKALVILFFTACTLACCPQSSEPKTDPDQIFVESHLIELKQSKPFYWYGNKRIYLEPHPTEKRTYVLCGFSNIDRNNLPQGWELVYKPEDPILYRAKYLQYLNSSSYYLAALIDEEDKIPETAYETYRSKAYVNQDENKDVFWLTNEINVSLKEGESFNVLATLADILGLQILRQSKLETSTYTISTQYSRYEVWQIAHILRKHKAIQFADINTVGFGEPLNN